MSAEIELYVAVEKLKAKDKAYNTWLESLPYIRKFRKGASYGYNETVDTIWNKLPKQSKQYWMEQHG